MEIEGQPKLDPVQVPVPLPVSFSEPEPEPEPEISQTKLTDMLISEIFESNKGLVKMKRLLANPKINVDKKSSDGLYPLIVSCTLLWWDVVKALLDKGANVNVRDSNRITPLIHVCANGNIAPDESFEIAKELINKGADVNATDNSNRTPLFLACLTRNKKLVQLLICLLYTSPSPRD